MLKLAAPPLAHRRPGRFSCLPIVTMARRDPTQTAGLRARFERDMRRRFAELIRELRRELPEILGAERVALEVHADGSGFGTEAFDESGRFLFPRAREKQADFMRWLRRRVRAGVLGISEGVSVREASASAWSNVYIDTAYQRGIRDAGAKLRRGGVKVEKAWIDQAFNRPVHADRVGLIYTRTFTELYDVTEVMARKLSETLAMGMAEGRNPLDIADALVDRVERVGLTRARLIARTEVIASHAEATLNAYEEAGVEGVEVEAEWTTAGDARVCPECAGMEGRVFTLSAARGMIPAHPNCRCAFLPKVVGGSGIVLNWRRRAPRNDQAQRRRGDSPRALRRPHAHGRACRHGGGRRPQRRPADG